MPSVISKLYKLLRWLDCDTDLHYGDEHFLECISCHKRYSCRNGKVFFRGGDWVENEGQEVDSIIFKVKNFLRKYPKIFEIVYYMVYPSTGKSSKEFIRMLPLESVIVNIVAGVLALGDRVIDVDYMPYGNVSVVTDAHLLPFKTNSVDAVISDALLEHVKDPVKVVKEIERILKPGGYIYILVPFIFSFHSSPDDYYRWTASGLRELLKNFSKEEIGVRYGPTSAMTTLVREWLSILFSFGNVTFYQIWNLFFLALFTPLNWLDFLLSRYKFSSNIANGLYFVGISKK